MRKRRLEYNRKGKEALRQMSEVKHNSSVGNSFLLITKV